MSRPAAPDNRSKTPWLGSTMWKIIVPVLAGATMALILYWSVLTEQAKLPRGTDNPAAAVVSPPAAGPSTLQEQHAKAWELLRSGHLPEAQNAFLGILYFNLADQDALRGLIAVRRQMAGDDPGLLRRQAERYWDAIRRGVQTDEHYSLPAMEALVAANVQAIQEIEGHSRAIARPGGNPNNAAPSSVNPRPEDKVASGGNVLPPPPTDAANPTGPQAADVSPAPTPAKTAGGAASGGNREASPTSAKPSGPEAAANPAPVAVPKIVEKSRTSPASTKRPPATGPAARTTPGATITAARTSPPVKPPVPQVAAAPPAKGAPSPSASLTQRPRPPAALDGRAAPQPAAPARATSPAPGYGGEGSLGAATSPAQSPSRTSPQPVTSIPQTSSPAVASLPQGSPPAAVSRPQSSPPPSSPAAGADNRLYVVRVGPVSDRERASALARQLSAGGFTQARVATQTGFRVVSEPLPRGAAQNLSATLAGRGIASQVELLSGDTAQLVFGHFTSQRDAEALSQRISAHGYDAWVREGTVYTVELGPVPQSAVNTITGIVRSGSDAAVTAAPAP